MIIDTHCHLYDENFDADREEIISSLVLNNIEAAFVVSTDLQSCKQTLALANAHKNIFAILGMYPENAHEYDQNFEDFLIQNANNPKVVAIGEIGLDYHSVGFDTQLQKTVFERQILLAHKLGLPLNIHCRDAFGDLLDVLRQNKKYLTNGGVIHCFGGSVEVAKEFVKLGFKLGFGGVCTFKNAKKVVETLQNIDVEHIVLETDAPYLAPDPLRGTRNQPSYTNLILQKIASIKGVDAMWLENQIYSNTLQVFKNYKKQ